MNECCLEVGQAFNPYKMFVGSFIPQWLECRKEINPGAKLIYARMCRYSGKNGLCNPRQEVIAAALGISDRHVRTHLKELEDNKLIESRRLGLGKSNVYVFLVHRWMFEDQDRNGSSDQDRNGSSDQDRNGSSDQDRNGSSDPTLVLRESFKRINKRKESVRDFSSPRNGKDEDKRSIALDTVRRMYDERIIPLFREKAGGELMDIDPQSAVALAQFVEREVDSQSMEDRAEMIVGAFGRFCDDVYWQKQGLPFRGFVAQISKFTTAQSKAKPKRGPHTHGIELCDDPDCTRKDNGLYGDD